MNIFISSDNVAFEWQRSTVSPALGKGGMGPNKHYLWIKDTKGEWYRIQGHRSELQTRATIKTRTAKDIQMLIDLQVL